MTNAEAISVLRNLISATEDDTKFSDPYLFRILASARNLLFHRKLTRFKKMSEWQWQYFCIPLCIENSHDCNCVKVGCKVLKSVYEIPRVLTSRNSDQIRIRTLGGNLLPIVPERHQRHAVMDPLMSKEITATLQNRRLIVWNTLDLKAIEVGGLWEDLSQWDGIQLCDKEGNLADCFDFYNGLFTIDSELEYPMYQMSLELLRVPLSVPEDMTNDDSNVIKV